MAITPPLTSVRINDNVCYFCSWLQGFDLVDSKSGVDQFSLISVKVIQETVTQKFRDGVMCSDTIVSDCETLWFIFGEKVFVPAPVLRPQQGS